MTNESPPTTSARVLSIDALRGFDMFWIIGGDTLMISLAKYGKWSFSPQMIQQFQHAEWEGFRFYDLIFPLFLFLVGCVIPFSLEKFRNNHGAAYWRIVRRAALLVFLGLLYNNLLQFDWPNLRVAGVLQRIGICYLAAAVIYIQNPPRGQAFWAAGLLLGYWILLAFVPLPGGLTGDFTKEGNLSGFLDRTLLPGKILPLYYGHGDNEGMLSTIPAIGTALLGVLTGNWLKSSYGPWKKAGGLVVAGILALLVGYGWGQFFPIIKNIWTSSYVLFAAGWSLLLLALFYTVIDVLGWKKWSFFFVVIGMNAITIYAAQRVIDFNKIATFFLGGVIKSSGDFGTVLTWIGILTAKWIFLWILYRQKLFLRV